MVRKLIHSPNIKLCVSSRPWNVFEAAFGQNSMQKVYVQDLNERDIQRYVRDKLEVRLDFQEMKERDARCDAVVVELVTKAQGVFLWVHLVVRSLIEGLQNSDRIVDLQRRLRGFPSDLEDYFQHIFDSLDPIYRSSSDGPSLPRGSQRFTSYDSIKLLVHGFRGGGSSICAQVQNSTPRRRREKVKKLGNAKKTQRAMQRSS